MHKKITTNIYSSRFKDLCCFMSSKYVYFSKQNVACILTNPNTSKICTDVNGEIIFKYDGWDSTICSRYDNAKLLKLFADGIKDWLEKYLERDTYDLTLNRAIHNDIYTKDGYLNKKSKSCSPWMKVEWDRTKEDISEIEGECPTTGEILVWFDFLSGLNNKTLLETYGAEVVDELIGKPANPFVIELEKNYRDSVKAKQDELSNIEVEINEKWLALKTVLEEKWNKELEANWQTNNAELNVETEINTKRNALINDLDEKWVKELKTARQAINEELKKLKEEHDAQLMMLKLVK